MSELIQIRAVYHYHFTKCGACRDTGVRLKFLALDRSPIHVRCGRCSASLDAWAYREVRAGLAFRRSLPRTAAKVRAFRRTIHPAVKQLLNLA